MDVNSLTPRYFDWAVKHLASLAIHLAKTPPSQRQPTQWPTVIRGNEQQKTPGVARTPGVC